MLHGMRTYVLQDEDGQTRESHSISAGLDYPGVGPEHSWLAATGRAHYEPITDAEAMDAFRLLSRTEGIVPAIESAHALAGAIKLGQRLPRTADGEPPLILVNLSGRGRQGRRHRDQVVRPGHHGHRLGVRRTGRHRRQRRNGRRSRGRRQFAPEPGRNCEPRSWPHRARSFADVRATGRGALVGFLHVGYPDVPTSLAAVRALTGEGDSPGSRPGRGRACPTATR